MDTIEPDRPSPDARLESRVERLEIRLGKLDGISESVAHVHGRLDELSSLKSDFAGIRGEMNGFRSEMNGFRSEINTALSQLSRDIAATDNRLSREIAAVHQALTQEIARVNQALTQEIARINQALSQEIASVHHTLDSKIDAVNASVSKDLAFISGQLRNLPSTWTMLVTIMAGQATLAGVLFAALRLIGR